MIHNKPQTSVSVPTTATQIFNLQKMAYRSAPLRITKRHKRRKKAFLWRTTNKTFLDHRSAEHCFHFFPSSNPLRFYWSISNDYLVNQCSVLRLLRLIFSFTNIFPFRSVGCDGNLLSAFTLCSIEAMLLKTQHIDESRIDQ